MFVASVTVTFSKVTVLDLAVAAELPDGVSAAARGDTPFENIPVITNRRRVFFMVAINRS
jgi:hypothetical protein